MAHGLKIAVFCRLRQSLSELARNWSTFFGTLAALAIDLVIADDRGAKNRRNALLQSVPELAHNWRITGANWSRTRDFAPVTNPPLTEGGFGDNWSKPQVPVLNWSTQHRSTRP